MPVCFLNTLKKVILEEKPDSEAIPSSVFFLNSP